jgi:OOP family OmpA-OmpF porin
MKRVILGGLLAAAFAVGGNAIAADEAGAVYISPMLEFTKLDNRRPAKDDFGYDFAVGYDFSNHWAAELNYNDGTFSRRSGPKLGLTEYSADVLYKFFTPDSIIRPYLIAGGGGLNTSFSGFPSEKDLVAEAGAGVLLGLGDQTGATRFQLRTEAKYRWDFTRATAFEGSNPGDLLVNVGLRIQFGAPVPPPPPPPPVAKVVEVVPPPPPLDSDGDGVPDTIDQCPNTPHGTAVDAVGCPLDSDGDGVPDTIDKCPNTPKGDRVDSLGCTIKDEIKLQGVNFATDSADLVPESTFVLDYAVASLKRNPTLVIEVHGHTDDRGSAAHNLVLSQHRAESVMAYLKSHGVTNTMNAKGYGKAHPIADNRTADGRLENRRVSLHIVE